MSIIMVCWGGGVRGFLREGGRKEGDRDREKRGVRDAGREMRTCGGYHQLYEVQVKTTTRSFYISRRYSEFRKLFEKVL